MENTFVSNNRNMHMILVAKIYNYDFTLIKKNNYSMHFLGILALKEASEYIGNFFGIIIGKIKRFGLMTESIL